jgi:hypothetical protein
MRINVYAEELTTETTFIKKDVDGRTFYGVRLFLKSPRDLHNSDDDDDRSAITFWVPWRAGMNHHDELITVLDRLLSSAWQARRDNGL